MSNDSGQASTDISAKSSQGSESDLEEFVEVVDRSNPGYQHAGGAPDLVVIFEGPYADWRQDAIQERMSRLSRYNRAQCCHIVHSVPSRELKQLAAELKDRGSSMYVTDLTSRFYESFGQSWWELNEQVGESNSRSTWAA